MWKEYELRSPSADCGVAVYRVRGFNQHRLVVGASNRAEGAVTVVVTIRSDYYGHFAAHQELIGKDVPRPDQQPSLAGGLDPD